MSRVLRCCHLQHPLTVHWVIFLRIAGTFFIYFLGRHLVGDFSNYIAFHCTLLNFFANCPLFLKLYFLCGTSCPAGYASVLMTVRVLCSAMQTTLSQRAVPATLLISPVVCRIYGGRTVCSFQGASFILLYMYRGAGTPKNDIYWKIYFWFRCCEEKKKRRTKSNQDNTLS